MQFLSSIFSCLVIQLNSVTPEIATTSVSADFLGISIFDNDFWKLVFKFLLNFSVILILTRAIYYTQTKRKDYLFTYIMISTVVFVICFTLKKFEMGMGMALGLFAVFGIIRYRTDSMAIKEMTYLFIIIGISVVNALTNKKMSYAELFFINGLVIVLCYVVEKKWLLKHESFKLVLYDNIRLIKPENYCELRNDLESKTGLKINRIEIGKLNYLNETAMLKLYFYQDEQRTFNFETKDEF